MSFCSLASFITISTSLLHIVHVVLMSCHFECHAFVDKKVKTMTTKKNKKINKQKLALESEQSTS